MVRIRAARKRISYKNSQYVGQAGIYLLLHLYQLKLNTKCTDYPLNLEWQRVCFRWKPEEPGQQ